MCHTHTHPFNGPFSGTAQVSRYQNGKTNLDFTDARDTEWQWHQLGHMQVCTLLQTDNHTSTPPLTFFTGRIPFLPPNQQHQSTEGLNVSWKSPGNWLAWICRHTVCGVVFEVSTRSSVTAEDSREATVRGVGVDKEQSVRDRWI